jgi:hypothetical protein
LCGADGRRLRPRRSRGQAGRRQGSRDARRRGLFAGCNKLSFVARNIFVDGDTTLIEFVLTLDDKVLTGIDLIEWRNGKMRELRAYLDV